MAKIGIFGGTFDPIHLGHLITAQYVFEQRNLEKILFIPCSISPFKVGLHSLPGEERLEMVKIAVESIPHFDVSDYEINKGDISYTLDTIAYLTGKGNDCELIIGYDNLLYFEKWREPDKILELAEVLVLKRKTESEVNKFNKYFELVEFLDTPIIDISSSEIRVRIREKKTIKFLVPDKVKEYIEKNNLYKY